MSNLLRQLDNNDSVLLMYVAGELPPEDRAEVEQMLATDPGMRAGLERLREANVAFLTAMPKLDRATRLPAPESVGVRRVVRLMRQWQAERLARPRPEEPRHRFHFPRWAYPLAAAASVVIAFLVWWGNTDRTARPTEVALRGSDVPYVASPETDVAIAWAMGGPADESEEVTSLIEPSDYALFFPIADPEVGGVAVPQPPPPQPPDLQLEDDEIYL